MWPQGAEPLRLIVEDSDFAPAADLEALYVYGSRR